MESARIRSVAKLSVHPSNQTLSIPRIGQHGSSARSQKTYRRRKGRIIDEVIMVYLRGVRFSRLIELQVFGIHGQYFWEGVLQRGKLGDQETC